MVVTFRVSICIIVIIDGNLNVVENHLDEFGLNITKAKAILPLHGESAPYEQGKGYAIKLLGLGLGFNFVLVSELKHRESFKRPLLISSRPYS